MRKTETSLTTEGLPSYPSFSLNARDALARNCKFSFHLLHGIETSNFEFERASEQEEVKGDQPAISEVPKLEGKETRSTTI